MDYVSTRDFLADVGLAPARFRVVRFDHWCHELDSALTHLQPPDWPPDLFPILSERRGDQTKRIALVLEDDTPLGIATIAMVGNGIWQPCTHYILPGVVFPVQPGRLFDVLSALNTTMNIALWRMPEPALSNNWRIRDFERHTTYVMNCSDDFEAYWKKTDLWRSLRLARNRCKDFELEVNAPGAATWTINHWAEHWDVARHDLADRIVVAEYLESKQKHVTLTLSQNGKTVAGITNIIHRGDLVAQYVYNNPEYKYFSLGSRMMHLTFDWARENGLKAIDVGGDHSYKRRLAPPTGEKYTFVFSAPYIFYSASRAINALRARSQSWFRPQ